MESQIDNQYTSIAVAGSSPDWEPPSGECGRMERSGHVPCTDQCWAGEKSFRRREESRGMKRRILGAALLTMIAAMVPGVTPSSLAAPPLPSAQTLIARSNAALTARGTFHVSMTLTISLGRSSSTMAFQQDVRERPAPRAVHEYGSTRPGGAALAATQLEIIIVGTRMAQRSGNGWRCASVSSALNSQQQPLSTALGQGLSDARTVGTTTLHGTPVWKIRAGVSINFGIPVRFPMTIYVSKRDGLPVRETGTVDSTIQGTRVHERVVATYSSFGERVSIALPAACRA